MLRKIFDALPILPPTQFLEDFISARVLPFYANTHNTNCVTAAQTTMFRHEARDVVRNAVNAAEADAVIFTGAGATAAVHKLIREERRGINMSC